jgi:hypothetical protein
VRSFGFAAILLLGACGSTLAGASPSPSATTVAPPSPSAAPSGRLPGSVVRITVNGAPYVDGTGFTLKPTGGTVAIVITFPFAVEKASVERWVSKSPITWTDDRTARLTFPETEPIGFKIAETRAADGSAVIDWFTVNVDFPATRVVNEFTVDELYAISTGGSRTAAASFRVSAAGAMTVSPDGKRAILFQAVGPGPAGPAVGGNAVAPGAPALIDLATRASTPLAPLTATDGPFAFAEWLLDGRLLIVGRGLWLGNGDGSGMRYVTDAMAAAGGLPWTAVPSPVGDRVAIWAYTADGHVAVVDLRSGSVATVAGPFRRYGADGRVWLAWSRDGTMLAGTDSDSEQGPASARVRITDVATNRTVRTIEGGAISVSSFPTGELVVVRDSGQQGAGAQLLGLVMGFDGVEHHRYFGAGWYMSPDQHYILQPQAGGAGFSGFTLIDLVAGRTAGAGFGLSGQFGRWLADGRLVFY